MTALHDAIARLNSGQSRYEHLHENIEVSTQLPILERGHLDMRGSYVTSTLTPADGYLLNFGGYWTSVEGGTWKMTNKQPFAFFFSGSDNELRDCHVFNSGTVARWGWSEIVHRCSVENISGNYAGDGHIFYLCNAANARLSNVNINGSGDNESLIAIIPVGGGFIDTVFMDRVGLQSYVRNANGDVVASRSCRFGLNINTANGKVVNVWASDCYLDHTSIAGIRILGPNAGSDMVRQVRLTNIRQDADLGLNVQAIARGKPFSDIQIIAPHFHAPNNNNMSIDPDAHTSVRWAYQITT